MERAKTSVQEELSQSKRVSEELCTEKKRLEQLLQKTEMLQEELQVELKTLREERKEIQEKLNQVRTAPSCPACKLFGTLSPGSIWFLNILGTKTPSTAGDSVQR